MNSAWKTVRVFISSTFRDMQAEWDRGKGRSMKAEGRRRDVEQLGLEFFDVAVAYWLQIHHKLVTI